MARKPKPEDVPADAEAPEVSHEPLPLTPALPPKDEVFGLKRTNH